ncbi:hypothetical protein GTR02_13295 [Kineococcus sp. R8]|uniref:hypothetical protein n=1 Tax=Kineococcus siccus TaxID=2696567 RepID=UPI001411C418|nr:hypothetical protein [Kineococcus siccus]NAZ82794.1 hypothetical protein [Kineococcus siccus]
MRSVETPAAAPVAPRRRLPARATWVPPLAVGGLAALTFLLLRGALVDDAYITLAYARNVAFHGTWGLLSDVTSNTATSPLWVLLLSAATFVVRRPVLALGILHVAIAVALTATLRSTARRTGLPPWAGVLGAVLVGVNPLLLSSVGLESGFLVLLVALLLHTASAGRPVRFGLVAGAVVLTRMDAAVVVVVLSLLTPAVLRRLHLAVAAALAVVVPWLVWSWFFLGSALPDTVIIKTLQRSWGEYDVHNGPLLYLDVYAGHAVLAFLPVLLGGLGWCVLLGYHLRRASAPGLRAWPWLALGVAGVAHYAALSVLGVPPYHWYYAVVVATTSLVAVAAVGACWGSRERLGARPAGLGGLVAAAVVLAATGAADVRTGVPWTIAPIQTNFAHPAQYQAIAGDLTTYLRQRGGPRHVASPGEIGHLAYACDCVVDYFADPALIQPQIDQVRAGASPLLRRLLDLNYRHRDATAAPVPLAGRMLRFDPGDEPPGALLRWPITTTWLLGDSVLVLLPPDGA